MVVPIIVVLVIPLAWLASRSWRWAIGQAIAGFLIVMVLYVMGVLGFVWPDMGLPLALLLNPYLVVTVGYLLLIAGAIGLIAAARRAFHARRRS